jgi:hypothetical protein
MKDYKHQAHEFKIGKEKRGRALLWPMRSGKTKGAIDKACYNFNTGFIEGVIVLAPNGVHVNWVLNEIPKWYWADLDECKTFAWITPKRVNFEQMAAFEELLRHSGPKWLTINKEALNHPDCQVAVRKFIKACRGKFMLIVDESHHFARPGAKRTRLARGLAKLARLRELLTGTMMLNGPLRAFSQYEVLAPKALGYETYSEFKAQYAVTELRSIPHRRRKREVITGYKNLDELREKIAQWSSVVVREDIHDMPKLLEYDRPVVMSDVQRKMYLEMVSRHLVEIRGQAVTAREGGARMMKLQQIVNGYIMDSATGLIIPIDEEAPIYEALLEQVDGTLPGKTLIWCRLREDVRRVCAVLKKAGYQPLEFHGGITDAEERERIRVEFNTSPKPRPLVGTLGTGGEGLDFSGAEAVLFFSVAPNAVAVAQGKERATVKGGRSVSIIRLRTYGTVDDRLWSIVETNTSLADSISGSGLRDMLLATDI